MRRVKVTKSKQILELEIMLNDMKNVTEGINSGTNQSSETGNGKIQSQGRTKAQMNGRHRKR